MAGVLHRLGHFFDSDCAISADGHCKECGRAVESRPRAWRTATISPWRWLLLVFYLLAVFLAGAAGFRWWLLGNIELTVFQVCAGIWFAWCVVAQVRAAVHDARIDGRREYRDSIVKIARERCGIEIEVRR